jgi:hypothetical protein
VIAGQRATEDAIEFDLTISRRELGQFARAFPEVSVDPAIPKS